jgi:hypothetical protein
LAGRIAANVRIHALRTSWWIAVLGSCTDEPYKFDDNLIKESFVRQAPAYIGEIDQSRQLPPILRKYAAGAQKSLRKVWFRD